jgi:cell division protein FtsQ
MTQERFFRPKRKEIERVGERLHGWLKRSIRIAFRLLLLTLSLLVGHHLYLSLSEDPFFHLKEVEIRGCQKIEKKDLQTLIALEGRPNLFKLSLKEIEKRISSHPWVEQVSLRKVFPDRLVIEIEERRPVAILQLDELYYLDSKGVIFSPLGERDGYNFPLITGLTKSAIEKDPQGAKDLLRKALELMKVIEQEGAPLLDRISEIHMDRHLGIHFFTQAEGIKVRMGWDQFGEKMRRLLLIWKDLQKRGVAVSFIDCSDLKRMVVKKVSQERNEKGGDERWVKRIR